MVNELMGWDFNFGLYIHGCITGLADAVQVL
jgi:hypothetical protein